jgi:hypothetical protein
MFRNNVRSLPRGPAKAGNRFCQCRSLEDNPHGDRWNFFPASSGSQAGKSGRGGTSRCPGEEVGKGSWGIQRFRRRRRRQPATVSPPRATMQIEAGSGVATGPGLPSRGGRGPGIPPTGGGAPPSSLPSSPMGGKGGGAFCGGGSGSPPVFGLSGLLPPPLEPPSIPPPRPPLSGPRPMTHHPPSGTVT